MWALEMGTRKQLRGMIHNMTGDEALREDLLQEALIHLWQTERERPGQSQSWYLQSCSFRIRHLLAAGRSVDSRKRRTMVVELPEDGAQLDPSLTNDSDNSVLSEVQVREIISMLSDRLGSRDKDVLHCLADGLGPREIGRRLKVSHPAAIKSRRKIAELALRLGIELGEQASAASTPPSTVSKAPIQLLAQAAAASRAGSHAPRMRV